MTNCAIGVYYYPSLMNVNLIMLTVTSCAIGMSGHIDSDKCTMSV